MPIEDNNLNILVDVLLEFIEAFIHQVIHLRSIYPPAAFERQKLYGIAVQKARHPELVEYIHQVVHGLKTALMENKLDKVVVVILNHIDCPIERFIIQPTLFSPITNGPDHTTAPALPLDILSLEAQLRAALLKLQYTTATLGTTSIEYKEEKRFEIVAYVAGSSAALAPQEWLREDPPLSENGLEIRNNAVIVPIKTCKCEGAYHLQVYNEMIQAQKMAGNEIF